MRKSWLEDCFYQFYNQNLQNNTMQPLLFIIDFQIFSFIWVYLGPFKFNLCHSYWLSPPFQGKLTIFDNPISLKWREKERERERRKSVSKKFLEKLTLCIFHSKSHFQRCFDPRTEVQLFSIKVLKSKFGGSQWSFVVENTCVSALFPL